MTAPWLAALAVVIATGAARLLRRVERHQAARRRFGVGRRRWARPRWWAARNRADAAAVAALPLALEEIARGLRAGASLHQACREAAAASPAVLGLAPALALAGRGLPLADALATWPRARPLPEFRLAATALVLAAEAGGPQARAVDAAADTVRERIAVSADVRAQSAQARLSALVIGCLPLAFLTWAVLTDRRTAAFLFGSPPGWACLVAGAALEATGAVWMRRIVRGAAP